MARRIRQLYTSCADLTARDNLATRYEGMLVYVVAEQIIYQLLPPATNDDWVIFDSSHAYTSPAFVAFSLSDFGIYLAEGTSISGDVAFGWALSPSTNLVASSISIVDVTNNDTLASGLADDGSQTVTLPSSVSHAAGVSHTWRISGQNSKSVAFTRDYTIQWVSVNDGQFYVRGDGSDSNTGTADNSGGAFLTLQKAADSVLAGDTVNIRAATYSAGFVIGWNTAQNGAQDHPISFEADSSVIITARNNKTADGIDIERSSYVSISGFTINNNAGTITRAGIRASAGGFGTLISANLVTACGRFGIITGGLQGSEVSGNTVHHIQSLGGGGTGHGIYVANSGDSCRIVGNTVYSCECDGIHTNGDWSQGGTGVQTNFLIAKNTLYDNNNLRSGGAIESDGLRDSIIQNNLIYNHHSAGIVLYQVDASGPSVGNVVVNNTVLLAADAGKHCVRLANGSGRNTVFNNILYNASPDGCAICCDADSVEDLVSDYNLVTNRFSIDGGDTFLTLAQWQTATGQDLHSQVITSLEDIFNSPSTDDYTVKHGGPANNSGIGTLNGHAAPSDDITGASRPAFGAYDIGAYENTVDAVVVESHVPANNAAIASDAVVTFTFDRDVDPDSIDFTLNDGNSDVSGSLSYDSGSFTATFTPDDPLSGEYTATVAAATAAVGGATMSEPEVWTFGTSGTHRLFGNSYTPAVSDGGDGAAISIGLHFYCTRDGTITKVWFYKDASSTGTHVAHVWDQSGNELAVKNFSGESSSGWQSVTLDTPVPITADTAYFVSVFYPNGHYSFDNTIHTKSNSPLFTAELLDGDFKPSCFIYDSDVWPGAGTGNNVFYGLDVEVEA